MKKTALSSIAALIAACFSISTASAQTAYTNSSAFFSAITSSNYTETYNSYTYQAQPTSPQSFTNNGFSYNAFAGSGTFYIPGITNPPADLWFSVFSPTSITFTNFSPNISAIGGNFFATDFNGNFTNIAITVIATFANTTPSITNYIASSTSSFLGFAYATNLVSLSIQASDGQYATVNNLTVGVVPEPSTYALLGLAAAGFAGYVIRRRRA
jgi:hypothetical protein